MRVIKEYAWCKEYGIDAVVIDIYDDYVTIWNSYKITNLSHMKEVIETIRQYSRIYNRTDFQLLSEWRGHNLLYDLNYETVKTKDVNFNPDILWHEDCIYKIMYFLYGFTHKIAVLLKKYKFF